MRRPRAYVLATILATAVISSCTAAQAPRVQEVDGIVMMSAYLNFGMDAFWEGTIELTETGCLGLLTDAPGAEVIPTLWPGGSSIEDDGESFEIDGAIYRLGDKVRGEGGEDPALPIDPVPACEADSYLLFNGVTPGS